VFFCAAADGTPVHAFVQQVAAALAAGNTVVACPAADQAELSGKVVQALLDAGIPGEILHFVNDRQLRKLATADLRTAGIAWSGSLEEALAMLLEISERGGAIVPMVVEPGGPNYLLRFVVEKTKTVNIVATGGNALLLNLDERDAA